MSPGAINTWGRACSIEDTNAVRIVKDFSGYSLTSRTVVKDT